METMKLMKDIEGLFEVLNFYVDKFSSQKMSDNDVKDFKDLNLAISSDFFTKAKALGFETNLLFIKGTHSEEWNRLKRFVEGNPACELFLFKDSKDNECILRKSFIKK